MKHVKTYESFINEAKQPLMKDKLGKYAPLFNIKPRATTKDQVSTDAKYAAFLINNGANCSQYTLITNNRVSLLDELDKGKIVLYLTSPWGNFSTVLYGAPGTFEVGDTLQGYDNDNYNKKYLNATGVTVRNIITSGEEWKKLLKEQGYQVNPPSAFSKPTGTVTKGFQVYAIKGTLDKEEYLDSLLE